MGVDAFCEGLGWFKGVGGVVCIRVEISGWFNVNLGFCFKAFAVASLES